jgi:hypothetical protein
VLPDARHSPPLSGQLIVIPAIPCDVAHELRLPVRSVSPRPARMLRTPVPEAAVDENRKSRTWEKYVDSALQIRGRTRMDSIP